MTPPPLTTSALSGRSATGCENLRHSCFVYRLTVLMQTQSLAHAGHGAGLLVACP